jgi:hypothetical protein
MELNYSRLNQKKSKKNYILFSVFQAVFDKQSKAIYCSNLYKYNVHEWTNFIRHHRYFLI